MKNKLDQDQIAMLIADWVDGELSTCENAQCKDCPLNVEFIKGDTICDILENMSEKLNEVVK